MKPSARTRLLGAALLLLSWTNVYAQVGLGPSRLLNPPAPTLRGPRHTRINLRSPGYVGRVGGVAFGGTAEPAPSAAFTSLSLSYRPEEKDGRRLWVTVDGRQFPAQIYDWQLVPIANFAHSEYKSCVTLFGELDDAAEREKLGRRDSVINYHPALVDNLLGLRIFQLDILINDRDAVYLPARGDGEYILGEGEARPDVKTNEKGWEAVSEMLSRLDSEVETGYRSYVITDEGRAARFDFEGGALRITGEPYIYFWMYKEDTPGYSLVAAYVDAARAVARAAGASSPAEQRQAYVRLLLEQSGQPDFEHEDAIMTPAVKTLLAKGDERARRDFLETLSADALRDAAIDLRVIADGRTVVPVSEYTERLSSDTGLLRSINPAVWDSGVSTMRYAAFFRYVKKNHPAQWQSFHAQVSQLRPEPAVTTPTVLRRSRGAAAR